MVITRWPGGHAFDWFASVKSIRYWDGVWTRRNSGLGWRSNCCLHAKVERASPCGTVDVSVSVIIIIIYYSSYSTCCDVVKFMVRRKNKGKDGECKEEEPFTLKK